MELALVLFLLATWPEVTAAQMDAIVLEWAGALAITVGMLAVMGVIQWALERRKGLKG